MKKLFTIAAAVLVSFSLYAEDVTIALSQMTEGENSYSYNPGSTVAIKNKDLYVELPSTGINGTISFVGSDTKNDRFLYICDAEGNKDTSRPIAMIKNEASTITYTSSDIVIVSTKPYLHFLTSHDYKFKSFSYTYEGGTPITKYEVTYKANGGEGEDIVVETAKVAACTFTAPTGKAFESWNTAADGSGKTYAIGDEVTSTLVLFAQWIDLYTVTFNLQGHGDAIDPQEVKEGGKVTKPSDPAADGYLFVDWYKEAACENAWDFDNDVINEDTELFAKWTSYKINAKLVIAESGDTPAANAAVALTTESTGGAIYFAGAKEDKYEESFVYNAYGLQLAKGAADSLRVELDSKFQLQAGSIIYLEITSSGTGSRGLNIVGNDKKKVFEATWNASDAGITKCFAYVVKETDTNLVNSRKFVLQRNNSVCLSKVIVGNCNDSSATAIDNTKLGEKVVKTIENGQLVIIKNGVKYNAQGAVVR